MAATVTTPVVVAYTSVLTPAMVTASTLVVRYPSAANPARVTLTGATRLVPVPAYRRWNGTTWVAVYTPN